MIDYACVSLLLIFLLLYSDNVLYFSTMKASVYLDLYDFVLLKHLHTQTKIFSNG